MTRSIGFVGGLLLTGILLAALAAVGAAPGIAGAGSGGVSPGGKTASGGEKGGVFPVRARHTYGDGLGAGRGHQGQDILAKCGKRVVAAQSGRVRVKDYQASGAGNYVVVKSKKSRYDLVYMHMLRRLAVKKGERVQAGDLIGRVGSTGRSSACHLHFEMWRAPGWYRGGGTIDPKPHLKRWDRRD